MRKSTIAVLAMSLFLIAISFKPMSMMIRETWIGLEMTNRYQIDHAYVSDGFPDILDMKEIEVNGMKIEIIETDTGQDAPQSYWDKLEQVPGGDIVTVQLKLDGVSIAEPTEMWLSNRSRGSRYFSWLDVLTVRDRKTGEDFVAIVQRLTDDDGLMEERAWRIVAIKSDGTWNETNLTYHERSDNPLGVRLVAVSGTSLMAMGYYSDILNVYPSLFFPLLYPWATSAIGFILIVIATVMMVKDWTRKKKQRGNFL